MLGGDELATKPELDELCINTIRFLSVDAVEKARSGHPGAPMGAASVAYVLWDRFLKHNPRNPKWPDRDRFLLSAGHASMLLYSLLYLAGYDLSLDDLKAFRQWGSKTPGHPEYGETPGVESTSGPLGQGFANGVGMAIAERWLAERYNRPGHEIIDHYTYALVSDGDLQEGVSSEAASLAGRLKLGKLIYLYDDNDVQIEGSTDLAFTEDVAARFRAYDWHVVGPIDGLDTAAVDVAIREAQAEEERPSLIICRTVIGYGSPEEGTAEVHGKPLGPENARAAKERLGWPLEPIFHVPEEALGHTRKAVERGRTAENEWRDRWEAYAEAYPEEAADLEAELAGELPEGWEQALEGLFPPDTGGMATRAASGKVLNTLAKEIAFLIGGSADLGGSCWTVLDGCASFGPDEPGGRNFHFGVREHAMGAIAGGMALHGGVIPYTSTFLVFSDYMRPPIRLAALMKQRVIYVFTHDSIGVGEDGPTHQPVEQLMSLRAVPNLTVIRPADSAETAEAWRAALCNRTGPTALILTRQKVEQLDRTRCAPADGLQQGGYVLSQSGRGLPDVILIGTGSETQVALEAADLLAGDGVNVRVVALPSWELFNAQSAKYRESVLPREVRARVSVEAGLRLGWEHFVGLDGAIVGLDGYGASAPASKLLQQFGITAENVAAEARRLLAE
jgi:transketolase